MSDSAVQSCPLNVICPVVFIPGIMGSRLRNKKQNRIVWDPGAGNMDEFWNTLELANANGAEKRQMLIGSSQNYYSPDTLEVAHHTDGWRADAGRKGLLASYLPFFDSLPGVKTTQIDNCFVVIRFVVWAYPYNWSNSNRESAHGLGEVVAEAQKVVDEWAARAKCQTTKPILVTHSMGGLVARGYTQILGKSNDVMGVIHGAMPTHGAPELYKRIRGGFEGFTSAVLGYNQEEVTATAANMPGPLELAPNRVYQDVAGTKRWLRALDGGGRELWSLPTSDPYAEIYRNEKDWYRLIEKELLNPGGDQDTAWAHYLIQLKRAEEFHAALEGNSFHPNTRMFYGTGRDTRDRVEWKPIERFPGPYPADADATTRDGEILLRGVNPDHPERGRTFGRTLNMQRGTAKGDGTVQAGSGIHVDQMSVAIDDGFEHQGAYDSPKARELTRDWLIEMVKEDIT